MSYHPFILTATREDDPIGARTTSGVWLIAAKDWKFIVGSSIREAEAFIVVVLVRIFVAADRLPVLVITITLLHGFVDIRLIIACRATSIHALTLLRKSGTQFVAAWNENEY